MKTIEIADQPWLGFLRTVRITIDGIRYRLFRATVTVAVIAVAVAFLMNILSESLIRRAIAHETRDRIERSRLVHEWSAKLTEPGSPVSVMQDMATAEPGTPAYDELQRMGNLTAEELEQFRDLAVQAVLYLTFFDDLDYARRRSFVHTATGMRIFERLKTEQGMSQFQRALRDIKSVRFVTSREQFEAFLGRLPELRDLAERVLAGRTRAIRTVAAHVGSEPLLEVMLDMPGLLGERVRTAGFALDAEKDAPEIAEQARRILDTHRLEKSIEERLTRQVIAQHENILPGDVNVLMMWDMLRNRRLAAGYLDKMKEAGLDTEGLSPERLVLLAAARREDRLLTRAERLTVDTSGGMFGLGTRLGWLLLVSMLVCGIGISNAMLMTVTERFREIATLKCLGALDGFIMIMFVLESCCLGIVGGVVGAIIGSLIGLGRMMTTFGFVFVRTVPVGDLFLGMVIAVGLGVVLAAVAAVGPSWRAARLAPMEAMRIE